MILKRRSVRLLTGDMIPKMKINRGKKRGKRIRREIKVDIGEIIDR